MPIPHNIEERSTEGLAREAVRQAVALLRGFHPPVPVEGLITLALSQVRDDNKHRVAEVRALEAAGKLEEALELAMALS